MIRSKKVVSISAAILTFLLSVSATYAWDVKPVIGVHGGFNFTQPSIIRQYQIITLLDAEFQEVLYDPFYLNPGNQVGFSWFLSLNERLSIGLMPQQASYSYGYVSEMEFTDYEGNIASRTTSTSNLRLNYTNIPLVIKYNLREHSFTPYFLGGFSYGFLRNAQHDVLTMTVMQDDTGELVFSSPTSDNYSSEFITSKLNLFAGTGVSMDLGQVLLGMDVSYWYGLNNIINEGNRFSNQTVSGNSYDIPADMRLNHLVVNFTVLFPINKVSNRGSLECTPVKKRK